MVEKIAKITIKVDRLGIGHLWNLESRLARIVIS
jgi:hypothetical protein